MGAYSTALSAFGEHGVQVYPTRAENPVVSMVRNPGKFRAREANPRFAAANAAFIAGPENNLTIVDIDAEGSYYPDMIAEMCGETPYMVKTPSGGTHMGYRHNGERRSIRVFGDDVPIDLLGAGTVVAPPSTRRAKGDKCAGEYRFNGDLSGALAALPTIREGLPLEAYNGRADAVPTSFSPSVGERNDFLFRHARSLAAKATSESDLVEALLRENERFPEPLPADEVQHICANAWRYKLEGSLLLPGDRAALIRLEDGAELYDYPPALALLHYVKSHHPLSHTFALVPSALEPAMKMSANTIWKARKVLVDRNRLELVSQGGKGRDGRTKPNFYRLSDRTQILGGIEQTPSPSVDRDRGMS